MPDPVTAAPTVGMVGGGQLARMTAQAAVSLGLSLRVLAAAGTDAAAQVSAHTVVADETDPVALAAFAQDVDVVTFDHEQVPPAVLRALAEQGAVLRPPPAALLHAQDKLAMRRRLAALGVPVPRFDADPAALARPVVAKAVRGGYDGRGVWFLDEGDPLPPVEVYVEERVDIVRELAAVLARRPSGEIREWPVVETVQRDGICVEVLAPAPGLSPELTAAARAIARTVAEALGVVGVLAVELFETPTGLVVNELAMRPHNSAHWTIDGAVTSQFEQHLRAVLDWPLGDPSPRAPATAMANVLGAPGVDPAAALPTALAADPGARVHLYGKRPRLGRKLGHVTVSGEDAASVRARAQRVAAVLAGGAG